MIIPLETKQSEFSHLIELIHRFPKSIEFFQWFAGEDLETKTHFEHIDKDKFRRICKCFIQNLEVFSGGVEFFLNKMDPSFSSTLSKGKHQYYSLIPELNKLEKVKISDTICDFNYTLISHFYYLNELCGVSWEVYQLDNLLRIYHQKFKLKK